ncbi:hypothetical protein BU14_0350s0014 [Porphyra umbilicalis]|uniref:Uncharacterized protein n=1 Tax=Porphyra umbilicalis TaxID=2786 RepID=A0A1X6NXS4_PORUM|nr:hypothetical protein BU14_0350s0014 [Porphyra umbilicalis]|eukprot:OSX73421.1 hypothetical protein BU14_0350s0014 [Porphyra umbilicalis]
MVCRATCNAFLGTPRPDATGAPPHLQKKKKKETRKVRHALHLRLLRIATGTTRLAARHVLGLAVQHFRDRVALARDEGDRAVRLKRRPVLLLGRPRALVRQREGNRRVVELERARALAVLGRNGHNLKHHDRRPASTMAAAHLHVHLLHGARHGHVAELLVHIDRVRPRLVTQPHGEVLDGVGLGFKDLIDRQDLTDRALHLLELPHVVPEAGLGDHRVGRKDLHPEDGGVRFPVGGDLAAHDIVLVKPRLR